MTDKKPKSMTASELLRMADSHPCSMCHLVMVGDESCATTGCASWAYRLADKIDAELSEARTDALNASLRSGAELWAMASGWPGFKDGEDFGAWLDRCFIPRPRFEDGEPVQFGELVSSNLFGAVKVSAIEFTEDGTHVKDEPDGDWSTSLEATTNRLKRPAPEVLGADGKPIEVGETVWGILSATKGIVNSLNDDSTAYVEWDDERWSPCIDCCNLTHTPPDTQERIDRDARKGYMTYWECVECSCERCPARIDGDKPWRWYHADSCEGAMVLDLLRRQRELDKRTGGAE